MKRFSRRFVPLLLCACLAPALRAQEKGGPRAIACLGRISPAQGIQHLAQPASSYPGLSPIAELQVKEGDRVSKGQVIAILENRARLETAWKAAQAQAKAAEARVAQVKAGASPADRAAQEAEVERLAAEAEGARINHERSEKLRKDNAISDIGFQTTQLALETRLKLLEAGKQRLRSMSEVREVDLQLASAQFAAASAEADHAKAELEQAFVRAPADGTILKIHSYPGEQIGPDGVVEFATLEPMYVMAEVHESDIQRVRLGQKASISGPVLEGKITGVVESIGRKVGQNNLFSNDPASANDSRVVEVKVRLDQPEPAAHYLQARVTVVIEP